MMNNSKTCAVIVTYNRLGFLKECIPAVLNQSLPLDQIIVVNNGSTDGTSEYLQSVINDKLTVVSQANLGGSGGFHTGIKIAYEQGFDWIWVMDDDVEPTLNCLENLFAYKELSQCIMPLRMYKDNNEVEKWEHYFDYRTCIPIQHANISLQHKDYCFVNTVCFEGMLLHRSVVEKVGYPRMEYFIAGDDTEYGFLIGLYTNILFTKTAILYRKRTSVNSKVRPLQAYYEYRNRFLLKKTMRQYFWGKFHTMFYFSLYNDFKKKAKMIIKSKDYTYQEKIDLIKRMWRGIRDGRRIYKSKSHAKSA